MRILGRGSRTAITQEDIAAAEFGVYLSEATRQVEEELRLEDAGWINLSATSADPVTSAERITNLQLSRLYYAKDPLGKQAIRLWTDYTFGKGITWKAEDDAAGETLKAFWDNPENKAVLSSAGVRKSSNKLLVDGEIFFALFIGKGGQARIRRIDPLEITEILTNPEDIDDVKLYRRQWTDAAGRLHDEYYRDVMNINGEPAIDINKTERRWTQDAIIYHLIDNSNTQRGNPLLLPALDWIKQYRRFLAARIAVALSLARFAWHSKVQGGSAQVEAIKASLNDETPEAGSTLLENMGVDTKPIKYESGSASAYQDGRMIKLQICAAVGIPEQYFGDISTGNLATAKTVELPMLKMFQSYQKIWEDTYQDINKMVLKAAGVAPDKWYVDIDFPPIAPADVMAVAKALVDIIGIMPELGVSPEVKQIALSTLGINNIQEVLDALDNPESAGYAEVKLIRALQVFRESVKARENGHAQL